MSALPDLRDEIVSADNGTCNESREEREEEEMLHPSYADLINAVNSGVEPGEEPVVQSRYSIVIATAKRARQLIGGEEAMVHSYGKKPLSVAVEELYESKIKILSDDSSEEDEERTEEAGELSLED